MTTQYKHKELEKEKNLLHNAYISKFVLGINIMINYIVPTIYIHIVIILTFN